MNVSLYKYTDKSNAANKLKGLTPVYTGDIVPYGAFDSRAVEFRLDTMYDVNYCKYTYNSKDWYGWCDVSVDSKGLIRYNITIDDLATAFYNGCMNIENLIDYSGLGSEYKTDLRLPTDSRFNYYRGIPTAEVTYNFGILLEVLSVSIDRLLLLGLDETRQITTSPSCMYYLMSPTQFLKFYKKLLEASSENQALFIPSILGVYLVDRSFIPPALFQGVGTSAVILSYVNRDSLLNNTSVHQFPVADFLEEGEERVQLLLPQIPQDSQKYVSNPQVISTFVNGETGQAERPFDLKNNRRDARCQLITQDGAMFNFKFSDVVPKTESYIYDISTRVYFNISGRSVRHYLKINDHVKEDYFVDIPFNNQLMICYDSSITTFTQTVMALTQSLGGMVRSGMGLYSSINSFNVPSAINSGVDMITSYGQYGLFREQQEQGNYSVLGGKGWDFSNVTGNNIRCVVKCSEPIAPDNFHAKFGKSDHTMRNLQYMVDTVGYTGYVQMNCCRLIENGMPAQVILNAQSACNAGFYIL